MFAKHIAQGSMHDVGCRMVGHDGAATRGIAMQVGRVAEPDFARDKLPDVNVQVTCSLLDIAHDEARAVTEHYLTMVAGLTAGFCIERRCVENEFSRAGRQCINPCAASSDCDQLALAFGAIIAGETCGASIVADAEPDIIRCLISGGEPCCAAILALLLERGFKTINIDAHLPPAQDVLREVEWETIRVG